MAIHYREYGDESAPLMLFLHGGGVSGWMWDKQVRYFSHYHCIVPDLPEHGAHQDGTPFSIKNSAEQLLKLIETKAAGKKVIVIGFSLGSQVIVQMLSMQPDVIDFAMINSALVRPIPYMKRFIKPSLRFTLPLIKKRWFSRLQAKTLYLSEEYFETYYEESCQTRPDTLIRVLEENMSFEIPYDFRFAKGKILITVGEKEKAVMIHSAKDIVASNSNCTGVFIPKIGHGAPLAIPDDFNLMVESWIRDGELPKSCRLM
ncbi:alpha/beta fold hydrolase [Paenibacillus sp. DYY-L-2]|uniref:alpha/beta fold hydrolase n=1 Tax=Paenibacillus sp. DYY-L-2 TaxID=3447013 RepID=UPI003F503CEB